MREEYQIGYLLRDIRKERGITQRQLIHGIYDKGNYTRIEKGVQEPDKLVLDILFERLGMSVNRFGTTYSIPEYLMIEQRNCILGALAEEDWDEALRMLESYEEWRKESGKNIGKENIHLQFVDYVHLVIGLEQGAADLTEDILQAIRHTIPEFQPDRINMYLYGEQELTLLILLAENQYRQGKREESVRLYYQLLEYMEAQIVDDMARCRYYPETVLSLATKLMEMGRYEKLGVCEKAVELLRETHRMNGMEGLLRLCADVCEKYGITLIHEIRPGLYREVTDLLGKLRVKASAYERESVFPLLKVGSRGQLVGEQILRMRMSKGISREDLSEGICDPESLRRIESGDVRPHPMHHAKLMERLGAENCRYFAYIRTSRNELHLAKAQFRQYLSRFQYGKAEEELIKLEQGLNSEDIVNRQFLFKCRTILDAEFGKINRQKELEQLWEALYLTVPRNIDIALWPLNLTEAEILNNIAIALVKLERRGDAIALLKKAKQRYEFRINNVVGYRKEPVEDKLSGRLLHQYRDEGMEPEYSEVPYFLIIENLINHMGSEGLHTEAIELTEKALVLAYRAQKSLTVGVLLYELAWNIEQSMLQEQKDMTVIKECCLPLFRKSYVMAVMSKNQEYVDFIQKRCKDKYKTIWND